MLRSGSLGSSRLRQGAPSRRRTIAPQKDELIALRKENQRLKMENDILKQAALITGRK